MGTSAGLVRRVPYFSNPAEFWGVTQAEGGIGGAGSNFYQFFFQKGDVSRIDTTSQAKHFCFKKEFSQVPIRYPCALGLGIGECIP